MRSTAPVIKRLPQFAEHFFASKCAEAGVVCNPSQQDECGWDFFIQFPAIRSPKRPADMQPPGFEALIQVKSTQGGRPIARMKLSNALRAVQGHQPYFVVLVSPGESGPRIYARHFWESEISRALRRIRLAEREHDAIFNRRSFSMKLTEQDEHTDDLLEWMRASIAQVAPSYSSIKSTIGATVGFEDGYGNMEVTFEATHEEIMDWDLGLREGLPIKHLSYVPQRFGIDASRPAIMADEGMIFVEPTGRECHLRLQGGIPTSELLLDAHLYGTSLPDIPDNQRRWRLDAGPLRILGGGDGRYNAKLSLRHDDRRPLKDLVEFLTIASWRDRGRIGLRLILGDNRISFGALEMTEGGVGEDADALASFASTLRRIADADPHLDPRLSIIDIANAGRHLDRFCGFIESPSLRMEYDPEGADNPVRSLVYHVACSVGEWAFLAVVERTTRSDMMNGPRREITFDRPRLLEAMVRAGPFQDHVPELEQAYRAQVDRLGDPETLWDVGGLETFISVALSASR